MAARVDGASRWRIFWDVTFPMLIPASVAAILLRGIEAFKIFDIVFYITGGGPGTATTTTLTAYFTGLRSGYVGYGGAMAFILFLTVVIFGFALPLSAGLLTNRRDKALRRALELVDDPSAGATGRRNGAVAQLGERRVRNAKVRGSTPLGSTTTLFHVFLRRPETP